MNEEGSPFACSSARLFFSLEEFESAATVPEATPVKQVKVRAVYSYKAAADDELTFNEGDILLDCEEIDSGWMIGRHPVSNQQGLLPSNYVEILH